MSESDEVLESAGNKARIVVTAGSQAAMELVRAREQQQSQMRRLSERDVQEAQTRLLAERDLARAQLADVDNDRWWRQATPERIRDTYATGAAWSHEDRHIEERFAVMQRELRERYGVEARTLHLDRAALAAAMERRAMADRAEAAQQRGASGAEKAEAHGLVGFAYREDAHADAARAQAEQDAEQGLDDSAARAEAERSEQRSNRAFGDAEVTYDSADRRREVAGRLEDRGVDSQATAARMRADVSQAEPATKAVHTKNSARARKGRARRNGGRVRTDRSR